MEVDDVGGVVRRLRPSERSDRAVVVVAVRGRARPERPVLLVGVDSAGAPGAALEPLWRAHESKWMRNRSSDASIRSSISGTGSPSSRRARRRSRRGSRPRAAPRRGARPRPTRGSGPSGAGVVVVVLALDVVAGELEQPRDGVAVRAVPCRRDGDRPGRIGRDQLDLDALARRRRAGAVVAPAASISASASRYHSRASQRLTKPGPATSARSTCGLARRLGELLGQLARRLAPLRGESKRDVRRVVPVRGVRGSLELDRGSGRFDDRCGEARRHPLADMRCIVEPWRTRPFGDAQERQLNIHLAPSTSRAPTELRQRQLLDYEFTITFARIEHEVEEGDVPGAVVSR